MSTQRSVYTGLNDIDQEIARLEAEVEGQLTEADRRKLAEIDRDLERAESWARGIRAGAAALTEEG
jgi:hypothetical protein